MATEVIVTTELWCDLHLHLTEEKVQATVSHVITIDGSTPRQLDLCAEHQQSLLGSLAEYLVRYGARPEGVPPKRTRTLRAAPESCPAPGCDFVAKNGAGLYPHVYHKHGKTLAEQIKAERHQARNARAREKARDRAKVKVRAKRVLG